MKMNDNDNKSEKEATLIGYARVSTKYQMDSLEAQKRSVEKRQDAKRFFMKLSAAQSRSGRSMMPPYNT